jgi:hypothetical protein
MSVKFASVLCALALHGVMTVPCHAYQQTERYIPIGQSPGLSGTQTAIGVIQTIGPSNGTITISSATGPQTVTLTEQTRVWLDRSKTKQSHLSGGLTDLLVGRKVEIKYEDKEKRRFAEWIKVEIAGTEEGTASTPPPEPPVPAAPVESNAAEQPPSAPETQ